MDVSSIINYVTNHWSEIIDLWLKAIGVASVIVKFTPTLKDDDVLKWVIRFVGKYIALNRGSGPNV